MTNSYWTFCKRRFLLIPSHVVYPPVIAVCLSVFLSFLLFCIIPELHPLYYADCMASDQFASCSIRLTLRIWSILLTHTLLHILCMHRCFDFPYLDLVQEDISPLLAILQGQKTRINEPDARAEEELTVHGCVCTFMRLQWRLSMVGVVRCFSEVELVEWTRFFSYLCTYPLPLH